MALIELASPESTAIGGVRLLGIIVGTVLLLAAMRAMFGRRK
jgi:xanthosine utilization system XapX-like protein